MTQDQRDKEDSARIVRQRPVLRVSAELALVRVIQDAPGRSGGEWVMKAIKELVCVLTTWASVCLYAESRIALQRPFPLFITLTFCLPQVLCSTFLGDNTLSWKHEANIVYDRTWDAIRDGGRVSGGHGSNNQRGRGAHRERHPGSVQEDV